MAQALTADGYPPPRSSPARPGRPASVHTICGQVASFSAPSSSRPHASRAALTCQKNGHASSPLLPPLAPPERLCAQRAPWSSSMAACWRSLTIRPSAQCFTLCTESLARALCLLPTKAPRDKLQKPQAQGDAQQLASNRFFGPRLPASSRASARHKTHARTQANPAIHRYARSPTKHLWTEMQAPVLT